MVVSHFLLDVCVQLLKLKDRLAEAEEEKNKLIAASAAAPTTGGAGSSSPSSSSFSTVTCNPAAAALVGQFGVVEEEAADLTSYMCQYAYNDYMMDFAAGYCFGGVVYDQFN
jgi:homeobox-leucine zipper protein